MENGKEREVIIALQLQVTALIAILDGLKVIEHGGFLHICRGMIAEQQQLQTDVDWGFVQQIVEGQLK